MYSSTAWRAFGQKIDPFQGIVNETSKGDNETSLKSQYAANGENPNAGQPSRNKSVKRGKSLWLGSPSRLDHFDVLRQAFLTQATERGSPTLRSANPVRSRLPDR